MSVIVPMAVVRRVASGISMGVGALVHPFVFYVDPRPGAASAEFPVVGSLTTLTREFIDASGSRCHYQEGYSTAR